MSNQKKRALLRNNGIDIEITVIANVTGLRSSHTGKYRYLISRWNKDGMLISNTYSNDAYHSYEDAENAALELASKYIN